MQSVAKFSTSVFLSRVFYTYPYLCFQLSIHFLYPTIPQSPGTYDMLNCLAHGGNKENKTETKTELLTVKLKIRLGPSSASLKALYNIYDGETVKIFQQGNDVISVSLGKLLGSRGCNELKWRMSSI